MGIIRAAVNAVHGSLADQWLETVEPYEMGEHTVFTEGILVRKGQNKKGSQTISNGSVIHVYDNQFMMLVDGGKIVDYTAEEGYYKVSHSSMPSMFNGQFGEALKESFNRIRFGGVTPGAQKVYYVNLQEIKGIKFGTRNPETVRWSGPYDIRGSRNPGGTDCPVQEKDRDGRGCGHCL